MNSSSGKNWKDQLTSKDAITRLFQNIRIENEEPIDIRSIPDSPADQLNLLITTKNIATGALTKAIISYIVGNPTWKQFIDLTYGSGSDTELKVIVFDEAYDDESSWNYDKPAGNQFQVASLVAKNNRCGLRTFLVEATGLLKKQVDSLRYYITEGPYSISGDKLLPLSSDRRVEMLPTKAQIEEAEFWFCYYDPNHGAEPVRMDDDFIGGWTPGYNLRNGLETETSWTEDGLLMSIVGPPNSEILNRIWKEGKNILEQRYPGCAIDFNPDSNGRGIISVTMDKLPLSELVNLTSQQKSDYGEMVYSDESTFYQVVEEILHIIDEKKAED